MKCGRHKPQVPSSRAQCTRATAVRANGMQDALFVVLPSLSTQILAILSITKMNFYGLDYEKMNAMRHAGGLPVSPFLG